MNRHRNRIWFAIIKVRELFSGGALIMAIRFAKRMEALNGSEIRELLKLIEKPEVISFAGGLPAPELFPIEEMKEISRIVLEESEHKHFNTQQQKDSNH